MCKIAAWWEAFPDGKEYTMNDMAVGVGVPKKTLNTTLSKEQNQEFLQKMRGVDGCNVRKAGGRVGYVYTKPAKEKESVYTQETLDLAKMMY